MHVRLNSRIIEINIPGSDGINGIIHGVKLEIQRAVNKKPLFAVMFCQVSPGARNHQRLPGPQKSGVINPRSHIQPQSLMTVFVRQRIAHFP